MKLAPIPAAATSATPPPPPAAPVAAQLDGVLSATNAIYARIQKHSPAGAVNPTEHKDMAQHGVALLDDVLAKAPTSWLDATLTGSVPAPTVIPARKGEGPISAILKGLLVPDAANGVRPDQPAQVIPGLLQQAMTRRDAVAAVRDSFFTGRVGEDDYPSWNGRISDIRDAVELLKAQV